MASRLIASGPVAKGSTRPAEALLEQSRTLLSWLRMRSETHFSAQSVLPGWDVRTLTGHLVLIHSALATALDQPSRAVPIPLHEWVRRFSLIQQPGHEEQRSRAAVAPTGPRTGAELLSELARAVDTLSDRLLGSAALPQVLDTPVGASSLGDVVSSRVVEVVVHADDLSRSFPDAVPVTLHPRALSVCSRTLTSVLAGLHPGRSIEVRVPPFAAVQCSIGEPGPTHTRGTPPNVVETDPVTFFRLATGRMAWAEGMHSGRVSASGLRADLSEALPLLS